MPSSPPPSIHTLLHINTHREIQLYTHIYIYNSLIYLGLPLDWNIHQNVWLTFFNGEVMMNFNLKIFNLQLKIFPVMLLCFNHKYQFYQLYLSLNAETYPQKIFIVAVNQFMILIISFLIPTSTKTWP